MTRRRFNICATLAVLVAILGLALATAGPAAAAGKFQEEREEATEAASTSTTTESAGPGPLKGLEGESESHPFPLDNYGLDEQVQFGVTHLQNVFELMFQRLIQAIWFGLIYVFNGIMVMLDWAFKRDLLGESMGKLAEALEAMRKSIDTPWGLAAIAALALWGIWNGLVRKKSIDTLRGLLASLVCMAALLVVIGNPAGTLGTLIEDANGASNAMLGAITGGSVSEPEKAIGSTEQTLFKSVILRPWCALQFGSVEYCLSKPKEMNQSVADTWLAGQPDGEWRTLLWNITKNENTANAALEASGKSPPAGLKEPGKIYNLAGQPQKVEMIGGGNATTMGRLGLLVLIAVGLIGAIFLFTYLAVRLLWAALFVLSLIMMAPAMVLVAALGEAGRESVLAYAKRLFSAVFTKVVFALWLAVIVDTSNLIAVLELGFFPTWIVFTAFWWGVLLKRKDLLALLSLDTRTASPAGIDYNGASGGRALSELFYARHLMGDVRRGARRLRRGATAAPRAIGHRGKDALDRRREAAHLGQSDAAGRLAREELENEGRATLGRRYAEEHDAERARSRDILDQEKVLNLRVARADRMIKESGEDGRWDPANPIVGQLPVHRARLQQELTDLTKSPEYVRAKAVGSKPREVSDGDVQAWVTNRRAELDRKPDTPVNLRAAGIDQKQFDQADALRKDEYREQSHGVMQHHRDLLDRAGIGQKVDEGEPLGFRERRQVRDEMDGTGRLDRYRDLAKERAKVHRQSLRIERRAARRDDRRRRRNVR